MPDLAPDERDARSHRLTGALLGVALGDALGLPFEGLSPDAVRFDGVDRFRLLGRTGFVSDDTEQSALILASCLRGGADDDACVRAFRRAMIGWFWRLPFGIGGATLRACVRMSLGIRRSGVRSAGNGAAMRAGVLGVALADAPLRRRTLGRRLAEVTHIDSRAVEAALYVAELAALAARRPPALEVSARETLVEDARAVVESPVLVDALNAAVQLAARDEVCLDEATRTLGHTGFVVHSIAICTFVFLRSGHDALASIEACLRAGGDTDTHAAIVGGWVGASLGDVWPPGLVARLHDGPFGPRHLRALAAATVEGRPPPRWSSMAALVRNLVLYPVILAHGFARLVPWRSRGGT
ncbi:MAG: ADP-ribosylglycohydrolase family protein [Polyangiales bacterium]|nr:ADP-ribosylglycohydrolase family protein [Myxococcales bacterium]MCB9603869.1 ADP-ribosylglycohydrolase family protein [Sandaracinus sp.]